MSCYEALAASYDGLTRDIPYEKYLRFFKTLLRRHGVTATTVLDLACGTGSLSVLLAKHGYRVLGVDRSEEMLTVAAEKAMELEENQPFFVAQPMQRLRLPQPVDACVCALDSINYVTKPQDVQKTFCRIYESLRPGGLFVFDINTPYKLESLDGQVFLDETEDSYCVWRTFYAPGRKICTVRRACGARLHAAGAVRVADGRGLCAGRAIRKSPPGAAAAGRDAHFLCGKERNLI